MYPQIDRLCRKFREIRLGKTCVLPILEGPRAVKTVSRFRLRTGGSGEQQIDSQIAS